MYKLLTSKGQLFAIGLGLLSLIVAFGSIISGVNSQYSMSADLNEIMKTTEGATFNFFDPAIYIVIGLIVVALLTAVFFGIKGLATNPKGSMKFLLGSLGLVLLFFILYSTADVESSGKIAELSEKFNVGDVVSKFISGGVKTALIGICFAVISAIVMEVMNLFK